VILATDDVCGIHKQLGGLWRRGANANDREPQSTAPGRNAVADVASAKNEESERFREMLQGRRSAAGFRMRWMWRSFLRGRARRFDQQGFWPTPSRRRATAGTNGGGERWLLGTFDEECDLFFLARLRRFPWVGIRTSKNVGGGHLKTSLDICFSAALRLGWNIQTLAAGRNWSAFRATRGATARGMGKWMGKIREWREMEARTRLSVGTCRRIVDELRSFNLQEIMKTPGAGDSARAAGGLKTNEKIKGKGKPALLLRLQMAATSAISGHDCSLKEAKIGIHKEINDETLDRVVLLLTSLTVIWLFPARTARCSMFHRPGDRNGAAGDGDLEGDGHAGSGIGRCRAAKLGSGWENCSPLGRRGSSS